MNRGNRHNVTGSKRENATCCYSIPVADWMVFCFVFIFAFTASAPAQTKPPGQDPWEKTLTAAKKDGRVHVYIGGWGVVLDEGVFQKRFPEIKLVGVALRGEARLPNAFWLSGEQENISPM
jgi:hypothetical protein